MKQEINLQLIQKWNRIQAKIQSCFFFRFNCPKCETLFKLFKHSKDGIDFIALEEILRIKVFFNYVL